MPKCDYGCGQEAIRQFKNGKWCCSTSAIQCPSITHTQTVKKKHKKSRAPKRGYYKGWWCDSGYELAFIVYNLEHNIKFDRNIQKFPYTYKKKNYKWMPDFIMEDGSYIEIKGRENAKTRAKYVNFPHKLTVMYEKDLKDVFTYVKSKYGERFYHLYDHNNII